MPPNTSNDLCVVFIHNHRFDENIGKLEHIYASRFPDRFHLVPFYRGSIPNVVPVYASSFNFQGFVAQADRVLRQREFRHYAFVADDLILNPALNAGTLITELGLDSDTGYIRRGDPVNFAWQHLTPTMAAMVTHGVNWTQEVPSFQEAAAVFRANGFEVERIGLKHFAMGIKPKQLVQLIYYLLRRQQQRRKDPSLDWRGFPYPMLCAYSDFFVVPGGALPNFSAWNGAFAAAGMFAELSIPATLLLACKRVRYEHETEWRGREYWEEKIPVFEREHERRLSRLFSSFPTKQLYVHPVKLSRWKMDV